MVADMIAKGELDPADAAAATPIGRLGQGEEIAASVCGCAVPEPASSSASPYPSTAAADRSAASDPVEPKHAVRPAITVASSCRQRRRRKPAEAQTPRGASGGGRNISLSVGTVATGSDRLHTVVDVMVVDERDCQPIGRPGLRGERDLVVGEVGFAGVFAGLDAVVRHGFPPFSARSSLFCASRSRTMPMPARFSPASNRSPIRRSRSRSSAL
jgi:hypothetical protein